MQPNDKTECQIPANHAVADTPTIALTAAAELMIMMMMMLVGCIAGASAQLISE